MWLQDVNAVFLFGDGSPQHVQLPAPMAIALCHVSLVTGISQLKLFNGDV